MPKIHSVRLSPSQHDLLLRLLDWVGDQLPELLDAIRNAPIVDAGLGESMVTCNHARQRRHETAVGDIWVCLDCLECSVGTSLVAVLDGVQRYVVVTSCQLMANAWARHRHLAGHQVVVLNTEQLPNSAHGLSPRTHELVLLDGWQHGHYSITTEHALKAAGFDVPSTRGRHEVEPMETQHFERWSERELDELEEAVERAQVVEHEAFLDATEQPFGGPGYEAENGS